MSRPRRLLVPAVLTACILMAARVGSVNAQNTSPNASFTLRLEPGATCLERGPLEDELVNALGTTPLPHGLHVIVEGSRDDPRTVVLRVQYPDGTESQRRFSPAPERCEHLHRAVALTLALVLKAAYEAVPSPPPAPQPSRALVPSAPLPPPPRAPVPPVEAAEPTNPPVWSVGAAPLVVAGLIGKLAGGGELTLGLTWRHWSLRTTGVFVRATSQRLSQGSAYHTALGVFGVDLCAGGALGTKLRGETCAAPRIGRALITPENPAEARKMHGRFVGATLGLGLVRRLSDAFSATLFAELWLAAQPVQVRVRDAGAAQTIHADQFSRVGAALQLGLAYHFAGPPGSSSARQGSAHSGH